VVKWNQGVLAGLAGHPLKDKRVMIHEADVGQMIKEGKGQYSAILLDVDNGPESLFAKTNERLYQLKGLYAARAALRREGVLAIWSAGPDAGFARRLRNVGFAVEEVRVNARSGPKAGGHHWIWLAKK
jgi:spermidine synthase